MDPRIRSLVVVGLFLGRAVAFAQDDFDRPPISYSTAATNNPISELQLRLANEPSLLKFDQEFGYLPSLLERLNVSTDSQVLVFSKTSLQRERIGPKRPRAIYFNDDVYVGYCQHGQVLEISAADAGIGTAFYTIDQRSAPAPRFVRQSENCLVCHGSSHTRGVPGHLVRSVYADASGVPVLSLGSRRIDHASPLADRWGGWYVTGTSGSQPHLGNIVVDADASFASIDRTKGINRTDLSDRFKTGAYLTPHSDLVALMVLEHQVEGHNRLTRASFSGRQAVHDEAEIRRMLGGESGRSESVARRLAHAAEPLVEYLLFAEEAPLAEPVRGTSTFADSFPKKGPRDSRGRSLRDLDLNRRLFKHPCSYLIYSPSFDRLPPDVLDVVWRRLWEVLSGQDASKPFARLSAEDRRAIIEIVAETKPNVPSYWISNQSSAR